MILFRPVCWLTRHHWELQLRIPTTLYADNELPRDEQYWYECQRCGKWEGEHIINLDNAPERKK